MKSEDNSAALAPIGNWIIRKIAKKRGTEIPLAVKHTIDALWTNTVKPLILKENRTDYGWDSESWVGKAKHFPIIVTVTESESRLKHIRERVQKENTNNLDFRVYLLDKIKEGLLK